MREIKIGVWLGMSVVERPAVGQGVWLECSIIKAIKMNVSSLQCSETHMPTRRGFHLAIFQDRNSKEDSET